jgi:hypothetical protein
VHAHDPKRVDTQDERPGHDHGGQPFELETARDVDGDEESGIEELNIENKDTNRPDLWSPEGIARALRGFLGLEAGPRSYKITGPSGTSVEVDTRLEKIRPFIRSCSSPRWVFSLFTFSSSRGT